MQRYYSINEMVGPKTIELYSELQAGKTYTIEGTELTMRGRHGNHFLFTDVAGNETRLSEEDLQQLIDMGDVKAVGNPAPEQSLSDFPALDRFTRNTFGVPTHTLLDLAGLNDTDLYTLEEMITRHRLNEMPLPGEGKYPALLADEHWPVLKHYLLAISPELELPEELG